MVCLGNICRSPLAEGILKSKVDATKIFVDSAGTAGYHVGDPPDPRSVAVAKDHGLDISSQKCRKFSTTDFKEFDHIYVMDTSNYSDILSLASNQNDIEKVKLLLDEISDFQQEVPDPYYGGPDGFEKVFQMIDKACQVIADRLKSS